MNDRHFDVVGVRINNKVNLYEAPYYSGIGEGDEVIVEYGFDDTSLGIVAAVRHVYEGSRDLEFLCNLMGVTTPFPKVISRIEYIKMKYEEENNEPERTDT